MSSMRGMEMGMLIEDFVTMGICQSRLELSKTIGRLFAVYRCKT